jgi:hypothetical protein
MTELYTASSIESPITPQSFKISLAERKLSTRERRSFKVALKECPFALLTLYKTVIFGRTVRPDSSAFFGLEISFDVKEKRFKNFEPDLLNLIDKREERLAKCL